MNESTSPFADFRMLARDCCNLGEFSSARTRERHSDRRFDRAGLHPTLRGVLKLCMACTPGTARTSHATWDVSRASSCGSPLEVAGGRTLEDSPVSGEPGAMQWAIPGLLEVIEANNAAKVRTDG